MKAIVLAAGKGTRLLPLTENRPKHLLEIGGKPLIKWILDELYDITEISEIILVINYHKDKIISAVNEWYDSPPKIVIQENTLGTGNAVLTAIKNSNISEKFLVINGDIIIRDGIKEFIQKNKNTDCAILGVHVSHPELFGVLKTENSLLKGVLEKPKTASPNSLINAGVYLFPPSATSIFYDLTTSPRGEQELTDAINILISKYPMQVVETKHKWMDVGHPWQLLEANKYLLDKNSDQFSIDGVVENGATLNGKVHVSKNAIVRSGVYIEGPVYIDEGADIGPNCYIRAHSYIGKNVRIGNACEIKNSIIYNDTHAAHLSYVGDSVLGIHSNLGAGTITANLRHDGKPIKLTINGSRINTGRRKLGVIMGDYVKTGIGVSILPGVKIKGKTWINANELVRRDI